MTVLITINFTYHVAHLQFYINSYHILSLMIYYRLAQAPDLCHLCPAVWYYSSFSINNVYKKKDESTA